MAADRTPVTFRSLAVRPVLYSALIICKTAYVGLAHGGRREQMACYATVRENAMEA